MAAYNTGPSRLSKSIAAQHVKDYWRLRLYREAERYMPRVIAAKIIMSDVEMGLLPEGDLRMGYRQRRLRSGSSPTQ